jgi:hypothetical protein
MRGVLKFFGIVVALIALIVVAGGLAKRSNWRAEANIVVRAPPEALFPHVGDLSRWGGWTYLNGATDPSAKWSFLGPGPGVGQTMVWEGAQMGKGRLELRSASPSEGIRYVSEVEGFAGDGEIRFSAVPEGTRVTWVDRGDVGWNLPSRWFVPMIEKTLTPEFEKALTRLKSLVENTRPTGPAAAAP